MRREILKNIKNFANNSPYYKLLGLKVVKLTTGRSCVELCFGQHLKNFLGSAHGGSIASLVDSAGGLAAATFIENENTICITVELKVNFLYPFTSGKLKAKGKVIYHGKNICVAEVDVYEKNLIIAKGIVTTLYRRNNI